MRVFLIVLVILFVFACDRERSVSRIYVSRNFEDGFTLWREGVKQVYRNTRTGGFDTLLVNKIILDVTLECENSGCENDFGYYSYEVVDLTNKDTFNYQIIGDFIKLNGEGVVNGPGKIVCQFVPETNIDYKGDQLEYDKEYRITVGDINYYQNFIGTVNADVEEGIDFKTKFVFNSRYGLVMKVIYEDSNFPDTLNLIY